MAETKPLGSEKLQGDEKLNRILELTYYNADKPKVSSPVNSEYISESKIGVYGIVKENNDYYVKKGLTKENLDYIGGMFMKNKNRFSSFAEALKRLKLIEGQEELTLLNEDTKYVLKVKKPTPAAPPETPAEAPAPMASMPDAGAESGIPQPGDIPDDVGGDLPPDNLGLDSEDGGVEDESDYLKSIQKLTGKLGEKLREYDEQIESDDIKYVINSVISAVNLDKLEDSDKEDIVSQLEDEEDLGGDETMTDYDTDPNLPSGDEEMSEVEETDGVDKLEDLISTSFDFNDDEDKPYQDITEFDDEEDEGVTCTDCRGRGQKNGEICMNCNGEGVVYGDSGDDDLELSDKTTFTAEDLYGDDVDAFGNKPDDGYYDDEEMFEDSEVGEEYTGENVFGADDHADVDNIPDDQGLEDMSDVEPGMDDVDDTETKEIELDELTNMVNDAVKETLSKYFEEDDETDIY